MQPRPSHNCTLPAGKGEGWQVWGRLWLQRVARRKEQEEGPGSESPGVLQSGSPGVLWSGDWGSSLPVPEHILPEGWGREGMAGEEEPGTAGQLTGRG